LPFFIELRKVVQKSNHPQWVVVVWWWCYNVGCCPGLPDLVLGHPRLPYLPKNQIIPGGWWCGGSCCPGLPYLVLGHLRLPYLPKNQSIPGGWWCGGVVVVVVWWWCGFFTDYNTTLGLCWVALGCGNSNYYYVGRLSLPVWTMSKLCQLLFC
jgi:hypothetical protein